MNSPPFLDLNGVGVRYLGVRTEDLTLRAEEEQALKCMEDPVDLLSFSLYSGCCILTFAKRQLGH